MADLTSLLTEFIHSSESNLQLDFYSRKQVILQIYKLTEVIKWNYGIENYIMDDFVVELTFNKSKIDNEGNKQRFLDTNLFSDFIKVDTVNTDSYWAGISKELDLNQILMKIQRIIRSVYDLKDQPIEYSLTAY